VIGFPVARASRLLGNGGIDTAGKGNTMTTHNEMTFDQALDCVIEYLGDEADHYEECSPRERRNHIWRAVQVLITKKADPLPRA
jgi:hypothetical protein